MENTRNLIKWDRLQELFELNGRVKAVLAALENGIYLRDRPLAAMLGGDADRVPEDRLGGVAGKEAAGDGDGTEAETAL